MGRDTRIVANIIATTENRLPNIVIIAKDVGDRQLGGPSCTMDIIAEWADTITSECAEALDDQASASTRSEDQKISDTGPATTTTITNIPEELRHTSIVDHTSESISATVTLENITKVAVVMLNAGIQST